MPIFCGKKGLSVALFLGVDSSGNLWYINAYKKIIINLLKKIKTMEIIFLCIVAIDPVLTILLVGLLVFAFVMGFSAYKEDCKKKHRKVSAAESEDVSVSSAPEAEVNLEELADRLVNEPDLNDPLWCEYRDRLKECIKLKNWHKIFEFDEWCINHADELLRNLKFLSEEYGKISCKYGELDKLVKICEKELSCDLKYPKKLEDSFEGICQKQDSKLEETLLSVSATDGKLNCESALWLYLSRYHYRKRFLDENLCRAIIKDARLKAVYEFVDKRVGWNCFSDDLRRWWLGMCDEHQN